MSENLPQFQAMVSTDWSECLSPNGPFDPITFNYPESGTGSWTYLQRIHVQRDFTDAGDDPHRKAAAGAPDAGADGCLPGCLIQNLYGGTESH